jgi:hypothetical protein
VPDTGEDDPSELLEKEAKSDRTRRADLLHLGHEASSSALLKLRKDSNLCLQALQQYSYIGICVILNKI